MISVRDGTPPIHVVTTWHLPAHATGTEDDKATAKAAARNFLVIVSPTCGADCLTLSAPH